MHYLHSGSGIGSIDHLLTTKSKQYKPILRPLSDIKNFEDIMDEFSIRSFEAFEDHFFDRALGRSLNCYDVVNYTIIELCFKHHLDIFDLIPKGLAISYSDVEST
jgi:hypothetical protein